MAKGKGRWLDGERILPEPLGRGATVVDLVENAFCAYNGARLREGVGPLWQKIALWRPGAIVFIDKRAAEIAAGRPLQEPWGQIEGMALAGRPCFLMPGPYATTEQVDEGLNFLRNLAASLPVDRP